MQGQGLVSLPPPKLQQTSIFLLLPALPVATHMLIKHCFAYMVLQSQSYIQLLTSLASLAYTTNGF